MSETTQDKRRKFTKPESIALLDAMAKLVEDRGEVSMGEMCALSRRKESTTYGYLRHLVKEKRIHNDPLPLAPGLAGTPAAIWKPGPRPLIRPVRPQLDTAPLRKLVTSTWTRGRAARDPFALPVEFFQGARA